MSTRAPNRGYQYRSLFWPTVLIGAGVIFLLNNMGILPASNLWNLWRLWPLALIIIGLDLLFGHRSPQLGAAIALGGLAVLVVLVLVLPAPQVSAQDFDAPVANAESATVRLDLAEWPTTINALTDSTNLIEAETYAYGDVRFDLNAGIETTVELIGDSSNPFDWFGPPPANDQQWAIGLTPDLPLVLVLDTGSGRTEADLRAVTLTRLGLDSGSGSTSVRLPANAANYDAHFSTGSGSVDVTVDAGASLDLTADTGSGSFTLTLAADTTGTVRLSGGSGSITVDVPDDAAVRIEVYDSGSGSVSVPGWLNQVRAGDDDEGLWESDGFAEAATVLDIAVTDAGSGSIHFQ